MEDFLTADLAEPQRVECPDCVKLNERIFSSVHVQCANCYHENLLKTIVAANTMQFVGDEFDEELEELTDDSHEFVNASMLLCIDETASDLDFSD